MPTSTSRVRSDAFKEATVVIQYARGEGETDMRQVQHWLNYVEKHGVKEWLRSRDD